MALKPTIYKAKISLADIDRNYYETLNLTVAQHPSETVERMMARILAFCINAEEHLVFTKGLGDVKEPDIWARTLDDRLSLWIEVGEPAIDKVKKATRVSPAVKVYTFNSKSDVWWTQTQEKFSKLKASCYQFQWGDIQAITTLVKRTMDLSITIADDTVYISTKDGDYAVSWLTLQDV